MKRILTTCSQTAIGDGGFILNIRFGKLKQRFTTATLYSLSKSRLFNYYETYEYVYQMVGMKLLFSGGVSSSSANKCYGPE